MNKSPTPPAPPLSAHAQAVDPLAEALPAGAAADPQRLQEVLPEIKDLAQKVGGLKKLVEIAETLEQADE